VDSTLPNVSDTARWMAAYRALESERPDALFKDRFAARLAGERGREMAGGMLGSVRGSSWPLVVRTRLIDELVLKCLAEGADRVLNLAAGLDTRPYRLALPPTLTWVEADLPALLAEKERALAQEKPACILRRESVDLTDAAARHAFLERTLQGARRAAVVTKGSSSTSMLTRCAPSALSSSGRRRLGGGLSTKPPLPSSGCSNGGLAPGWARVPR